ncbi:dienelactone hydrolase [uncultured Brevundimonas sp.]|uniref:alpha/beta hydrolase family protein n=1 Tax=uncultured Brevundimonas sp. TaxID=213418 RepID=UPI0030EF2E49|tara:strand:- start:1508 stop:2422 length:915 start_codon:yes stop_codon:yes gene_type:complete
MRLIAATAALLALTFAAPALAQSVMQRIQFADPAGKTISAAVWTPETPSTEPRALVVMSHGNGGAFGGHQDTAEALAEAGFVVAALTHPGDNYLDMSRSLQLTDRPPHVSALITYMTDQWRGAAGVDKTRIGAFGFSAGGFTVLTLAGGESDAGAILDHCAAHAAFFVCTLFTPQTLDVSDWRPRGVDNRIKAIVAAAPGFGFSFSDVSLQGVRVPVQLWQAGEDQILPAPFHVETLRDRLPGEVEYHLVPGALHHDFLAPCAPDMSAAMPELCRSNPGFDRAAFKAEFNQGVVRFFSRELPVP